MTTSAKTKSTRKIRSAPADRTVVYRGIKIAPIDGRRSALSKIIRDGLRSKSEQSRGASAQG